jgi:hypothetical protein
LPPTLAITGGLAHSVTRAVPDFSQFSDFPIFVDFVFDFQIWTLRIYRSAGVGFMRVISDFWNLIL